MTWSIFRTGDNHNLCINHDCILTAWGLDSIKSHNLGPSLAIPSVPWFAARISEASNRFAQIPGLPGWVRKWMGRRPVAVKHGKFGYQEDSFGVVELVAVKPFEDSIWPSEIKSQLFVWCFWLVEWWMNARYRLLFNDLFNLRVLSSNNSHDPGDIPVYCLV